MKKKTEQKRGRDEQDKLVQEDWLFEDARVSDKERAPCCYWEYARESDFIRRVVQGMKDVDQGKTGNRITEEEMARLYSEPSLAKLLYQLPFPKPWQALTEGQRKEGVELFSKAPAWPAFQTTDSYNTASELFRQAKQSLHERNAAFARLAQLDAGLWNKASEAESSGIREKFGKQKPLRVQGCGVVSFIGQVNWHEFDKKEIVSRFEHWLDSVVVPRDKRAKRIGQRGRGRGDDWRVMLDRLSMMRLLSNYRERDIPNEARSCFSHRQITPDEWYKGRRDAKQDFHRLLAGIVPDQELPRSWGTAGGRSS